MTPPAKSEILAALRSAGLDAVQRAADPSHYPTADAAALLSWLAERGLAIVEVEDWRVTEDGPDEICTGVRYAISQGDTTLCSFDSEDLI